jgi:hypothetical protein
VLSEGKAIELGSWKYESRWGWEEEEKRRATEEEKQEERGCSLLIVYMVYCSCLPWIFLVVIY